MRDVVQQGQESKRVVAERLQRLQSDSSLAWAVGAGTRLENPLGVFGARTVEASRKALPVCSESRAGSELLPDVAEKLATGSQENALQNLCPCSAQRPSPFRSSFAREVVP